MRFLRSTSIFSTFSRCFRSMTSRDWCKVLGCTPEQLREAVDHVGTTPVEVRQFLRAKSVGNDAYGRDPRVGDGSRMDAEGGDASPEMVECWYWRYRDPGTGQVCVSEKTLTAEEASSLPEAERIESSRTLRGTGEEDTTPDVFRTDQAPLT